MARERNKGIRGNKQLTNVSEIVAFSEDQEAEFIRCKLDPVYFVKTYMKIRHPDRGIIPFDLWPWQEEMLQKYKDNRFVISRIARQSGKTSVSIAYFLWLALFHKDKLIAIMANKGKTAISILSRIRLAYENLPKFLQQGIITWNKGDIELANGSKIFAYATSSDSVRGDTFSAVLLDELAFVAPNEAEAFYTSTYPAITAGEETQVFIVSTPNGIGNLYHKMWVAAEKGESDYVPFTVNWWDVPGRDEEWKKKTIRNTSERQFEQEFNIEFLGSSDTLISGSKLRALPKVCKDPIYDDKNGTVIFEEPILGHNYAMTVDVSEGLNQDYHAFSIFDVTSIPYKMVARFRNNEVSPIELPNHIFSLGMKYNQAFILTELNNSGGQVADMLQYDLEYENLYRAQVKNHLGITTIGSSGGRYQFGIKTTVTSKRVGCANLKSLIEDDKLIIPDWKTVEELGTFVRTNNTFKAQEGCNDDMAMSLVLFAWLVAQKEFRNVSETDIFQNMKGDVDEAVEVHAPILDPDVYPLVSSNSGTFAGRTKTEVWLTVPEEETNWLK